MTRLTQNSAAVDTPGRNGSPPQNSNGRIGIDDVASYLIGARAEDLARIDRHIDEVAKSLAALKKLRQVVAARFNPVKTRNVDGDLEKRILAAVKKGGAKRPKVLAAELEVTYVAIGQVVARSAKLAKNKSKEVVLA